MAATQTIKTTTTKRAVRAYPYNKTQENNSVANKKTTNNKPKHTRKVKRGKKNASK